MVSELDALGDELLLDDDSSYLDEASAAPSIPEGIPSDSKTNKVRVCRTDIIHKPHSSHFSLYFHLVVTLKTHPGSLIHLMMKNSNILYLKLHYPFHDF